MPRFQVDLQWLEAGCIEVEAATEEEAVQLASRAPLPEEHWPAAQRRENSGQPGDSDRHPIVRRFVELLADAARSVINIRLYGDWYSIFISALLLLIGASFVVQLIGEKHLHQWTIWAMGAATAVEAARIILWWCGLPVGLACSVVGEGPTVSASGATIQQIHRLPAGHAHPPC